MTRDQVFNIPELFDSILLYLPFRDLLLAQRVCRHWKHHIEASRPIQRALFFLPTSISPTSDPNSIVVKRNRLLERTLRVFTLPLPVWTERESQVMIDKWNYQLDILVRGPPHVPGSLSRAAPYTPSWMRMLLSQPPPLKATVMDQRLIPFHFSPERLVTCDLEDEEGLRVCHVVAVPEIGKPWHNAVGQL
ncbi:hypothetical protein GQ43DRAFT_444362 [Delitschia confertaspora ATCC 74209]|uniref:F-box domain-containing protein n=1 Tax=Delitschia confertaspora ATCC 74209 TaxID=1513339 RepID=A0A9P4JDU6_9PLEO|nr:hypothetical protein GQ43DRAFT_444362 [Delitschia confertaspora ATCC 74209]